MTLALLQTKVGQFKLGACLALFVALFVLSYVAAVSPTGQAKRLGLRGLNRKRALENVPLWSQAEPLVRWLGARFSGLMSNAWRRKVDKQIELAGDFMGLVPEEVLGFAIVSGVGGLVAGTVFGWASGMGSILMLAGGALGTAMPSLRIASAATERMRSVSKRLPYAIDLLALAMGAGLDFPGAVRQVVEKSSTNDAVVEEFTLILQGLQLGRTRRQTLEEFAVRVPANAVVEFVGSVVQAEVRGNPVVETLKIQAEVSRRRRSVAAEEAASKAGVKMVLPLVLVFVAILILIVAPMAMQLQGAL